MLNLNSTTIALKALRITASIELASEDASGQSSSTDNAETGNKAKILTIAGYVPFTDSKILSDLFTMAEATESGARSIYRISNNTAGALGIKQVRFSSKVEAVEQDTTRQWRVTFTLAEYRSVPQKVEERQPDAPANQQGASTTGESGFQYASLQQNLTDNFGSLRS